MNFVTFVVISFTDHKGHKDHEGLKTRKSFEWIMHLPLAAFARFAVKIFGSTAKGAKSAKTALVADSEAGFRLCALRDLRGDFFH